MRAWKENTYGFVDSDRKGHIPLCRTPAQKRQGGHAPLNHINLVLEQCVILHATYILYITSSNIPEAVVVARGLWESFLKGRICIECDVHILVLLYQTTSRLEQYQERLYTRNGRQRQVYPHIIGQHNLPGLDVLEYSGTSQGQWQAGACGTLLYKEEALLARRMEPMTSGPNKKERRLAGSPAVHEFSSVPIIIHTV
jgi:hypothetical protein